MQDEWSKRLIMLRAVSRSCWCLCTRFRSETEGVTRRESSQSRRIISSGMALANKGFGRIQKKKRKDLREREREIVGEQERKLLFARREERVIDPQEALLLPPPTSKKKRTEGKSPRIYSSTNQRLYWRARCSCFFIAAAPATIAGSIRQLVALYTQRRRTSNNMVDEATTRRSTHCHPPPITSQSCHKRARRSIQQKIDQVSIH